jgi:hypothetical protein
MVLVFVCVIVGEQDNVKLVKNVRTMHVYQNALLAPVVM